MAERTGSWWSSGVFSVLNLVAPSRTIVPSAPTAGSAIPATRAPPTAAATISRTTTLALPRSVFSAMKLGVRTDSEYARWLIRVVNSHQLTPNTACPQAAILRELPIVQLLTTDCPRHGPCGLSRKWTVRGLAPDPGPCVSYLFATWQQEPVPPQPAWIASETPPGVTTPPRA